MKKQLASEEQLGELESGKGEEMAGPNSEGGKPFRDSKRVATQHGGVAEDWQKVRSSSHKSSDEVEMETYAVQNSTTGAVVELKTKMTQTANKPPQEPKYKGPEEEKEEK